MRSVLRVLSVSLAVVVALPAWAERRALVIGNAAYQTLDPLKNTIADARGYAEAFGGLGFEVTFLTDLDEGTMVDAVVDFVDGVAPGDEVAFVFAGHGWSAEGINYLIPTDAPKSGSARQLSRRSLPLKNGVNGVLDDIAAQGAGLSLAIIDACRDNPFAGDGTRSIGSTRGLARIEPQQGSFVIYSAGEGQTALDRLQSDGPEQSYSVFTRHFLPLLTADMYLEDAVFEAQERTAEAARSQDHLQIPAVYRQKLGKTCLTGDCRGNAVPAAAPAPGGWYAERKVPEGMYVFGEGAPLVSPDGARIVWPLVTQSRTAPSTRRFSERIEVFDNTGKRISAFEPDFAPQVHAFLPSGEHLVLGTDSALYVLSDTGSIVRRTPLSTPVDFVSAHQMMSSGKLRLRAEFGEDFTDGLVDVDLETGEVSKPIWTPAPVVEDAFLLKLKLASSGQFSFLYQDAIHVYDRDGRSLNGLAAEDAGWKLFDHAISPQGVFALFYGKPAAQPEPGRTKLKLTRMDWQGGKVSTEFDVPSGEGHGWELMAMTADALGVTTVAVLDLSRVEVRRFDPFGETATWIAVLPWEKGGIGPPIGATQLADGGAAVVQYPYLPDGVTGEGAVVRLTRIGPNGEVPQFD